MNRILVTGASGHVGRHLVSQLSCRGVEVRALVRNPHARHLPPGVEVALGDLTVPESLEECLHDVDAVFLVWTAPPGSVAPGLERVLKHARRIVFLSSPYKTAHPFFQGGQPNPVSTLHAEIEQRIENSGIQWTFLRPGMFAGNALRWWAPQIRGGDVVRWPYQDASTAPINERDIAAVAVRALCEDGHAGAEYILTGPESLSQAEQVYRIGRAIGRSLRVKEISPEEARRELLALIPSVAVVEMLLRAWAAAVGEPALVTSTVEEITGEPAGTFIEWATEQAGEFGT